MLSGGLITFASGQNANSATLRNLDLSLPVYAEDGTTQCEFSPHALGQANYDGRVVTGTGLTNVVLSADLESFAGDWLYNVASTGSAHVWFRNLPGNLSGSLWANTTKQHHDPPAVEPAGCLARVVASGPSGHEFTFNKATKTLPEHLDDVGTWKAGFAQNVTWWKDAETPTLVLIK